MITKADYTDLTSILWNNEYNYIRASALLIPNLDKQFLRLSVKDTPMEFIHTAWGIVRDEKNGLPGDYSFDYCCDTIHLVGDTSPLSGWFYLPFEPTENKIYQIDSLCYITSATTCGEWVDVVCMASQMMKDRTVNLRAEKLLGRDRKVSKFITPEVIKIPGWLERGYPKPLTTS